MDDLGKVILAVLAAGYLVVGGVYLGGKRIAKGAKVKNPGLWGVGGAGALIVGSYLFLKSRQSQRDAYYNSPEAIARRERQKAAQMRGIYG